MNTTENSRQKMHEGNKKSQDSSLNKSIDNSDDSQQTNGIKYHYLPSIEIQEIVNNGIITPSTKLFDEGQGKLPDYISNAYETDTELGIKMEDEYLAHEPAPDLKLPTKEDYDEYIKSQRLQ
jgi:hypothetical protein